MNKLEKFAEMTRMANVIQCPRHELLAGTFPYRGRWSSEVFKAGQPVVLELGCGRGEYTVALAESDPTRGFVGIDIKGARMYHGARRALDNNIDNARFLRTEVELLNAFFNPGEVDEIWITFPDPQMKKVNKRLTSARFLESYRRILRPGGRISLKTDSPFLFEFTKRIIAENGFEIEEITDDLYGSGNADPEKSIKTAYECQWLARGKKIKLIRFRLTAEEGADEAALSAAKTEENLRGYAPIVNPKEDDIEHDDYRAIPRASSGCCLPTGK